MIVNALIPGPHGGTRRRRGVASRAVCDEAGLIAINP